MKPTGKRIITASALIFAIFPCLLLLLLNVLPYLIVRLPADSWKLRKADTIIVLGATSNKDGTPSPPMRERVSAAVRLFKQGYAGHLIMSGAAAHNKFVKAEVMSGEACRQGVPAESVILEPAARNTAQNAFNSVEIMKQHNWSSAIVISSAQHLLRSNLIFSNYPISYCMYPAGDPPESSLWSRIVFDQREKWFVISDVVSRKGPALGLKPEQAARMPELVRQAQAMHR